MGDWELPSNDLEDNFLISHGFQLDFFFSLEIPKLREYIREIYLKEKKKAVTEYVTNAYSIHQLAENFGSERLLVV